MKLRLSFRATLMTIVGVTALAFILLIVASGVVATRVEKQLSSIQNRYLPKVVLRPELEGAFDRLRRGFQDAVAAHDLEMLQATKAEKERFLQHLADARQSVDPEDDRALRQALDEYYSAAFDVSRRLIADETGEALVEAMSAMQAKQIRLGAAVEKATAFDGRQMSDAFAAAARSEADARTYRLWISVACLAVVLAIWLGLSRSLLRSVGALTAGFGRFGAGQFADPVPVEGSDELADLAVQANTMAASLERSVKERIEAEEKFRSLLESAPDAMVIVGMDGRIALVNAQTEKLFGFARHELIGGDANALLPEHLREKSPLGPVTGSAARPAGASFELSGRHKNGSEFPIEIAQNPLETDDGILVSSAIRDITQRKIIETALETSNRELEAFSYSVAHDLRAPLRGINGFSRTLLEDYEGKLDDEGKEYLNRIAAASERMGLLIDALLALSRVSRAELQRDNVNLSNLAEAVVKQLRLGQPERAVEYAGQEAVTAQGDPALLRALFDNLLGNAWKFTGARKDAAIAFGTTRHNGSMAYYVKDNGAGFDMAYAGKLFAPFQRLHHVKEFAGTGIGLATVQRIVRRHGGEIWAEASVGAGATFYFTLSSSAKGMS
jgi:PAS domain S-box-containing protein